MQQYVINDWQPVEPPANWATKMNTKTMFEDLKFRHYLFLLALPLLIVCAPLAWYAAGDSSAGLFCVGLAFFLVSWASILAPDEAELQTE
jgi:hypothetical protein